MQGQVLQNRYGITRVLTTEPTYQAYLAEDLPVPGNPTCLLEGFTLDSPSPQLHRAAQRLFAKEAAALQALPAHPALLRVQAYFEQADIFYVVQDWLPGVTLAEQFAAEAAFTEADVIALLREVLDGLQVLHESAIVHGNLEPASLLLHPVEQHWLLTHYGAIRQIPLLRINQTGKVTLARRVGHRDYCPHPWPGKLTPRYDLYSVGRIAVQALTGRSPQHLGEQWDQSVMVSDRVRNVIHGLLSQAFAQASEASQWLQSSGVGQMTTLEAPPDTQVNLSDLTALLDLPPREIPETMRPLDTAGAPQLLAQRYRILKPLGDGGFGRTYLAQDEQFPGTPKCVVKQLRPYSTSAEMLNLARRLFHSEAEVLSRLGEHPQIPHLLAHFEENAEFYLVQDYIEGHDLETELRPGKRWSEAKVTRLLRDVLEVLSFVHEQNVIHRDIKPANIRRRPDGKIVLIDFGAVKQVATEQVNPEPAHETQLTVAIGTPGYAPSEQTKGKPRLSSDVYAVGMIAIEALTGIDPEKLPEDPRTGELIWHDRAQVSSGLKRVIDRMVRYDFRERYPAAKEALQALNTMGTTKATVVRSLETLQASKHFPKPWVLAGVGAIAIALIASGLTLSVIQRASQDTPSAEADVKETATPDTLDDVTVIPELAAIVEPLPFQVIDAAYQPTLNKLVMVSREPNQLHIYSPLSGRLQNISLPDVPLRVTLDATGRWAAVALRDRVVLINVLQSQVTKVLSTSVPVHDFTFVGDRWLYYSSVQDNRLWGLDTQTEEITATEGGSFNRATLIAHPNQLLLLALNAESNAITLVETQQFPPRILGSSTSERAIGEALHLLPNGQVVSNRGVVLGEVRPGTTLNAKNLPLTNGQNSSPKRVAIAASRQQILALDGESTGALTQLVQLSSTTFNRQQTWKLPPAANGEASGIAAQFLFVNPQSGEYYILGQQNPVGTFQLWRGSL